jgi:hypothetical protein
MSSQYIKCRLTTGKSSLRWPLVHDSDPPPHYTPSLAHAALRQSFPQISWSLLFWANCSTEDHMQVLFLQTRKIMPQCSCLKITKPCLNHRIKTRLDYALSFIKSPCHCKHAQGFRRRESRWVLCPAGGRAVGLRRPSECECDAE